MHSCRRRFRVLPSAPQGRHLQHHLLPAHRITSRPAGLIDASILSGNKDATAAARVHFWHRGPSLPMTANVEVTPSRGVCRFERYMSTVVVAKGQSAGSSPPPPLPPPPPPSSSLQGRLGISGAEAEIIRRKYQISKPAFENLITARPGLGGGSGGDSGSTLGDSPSLSPPQAPPARSCFSRFLLDDLRVKPESVKSLVLRRPIVLNWSSGAAEKVSRWLQESLGMRRSEVAQLLLRSPEAGTKSVENNLEVKVKWLRDNLDLGETDNRGAVKVLLNAPQILNLSIERSLEPMLLWLKDRLGVSRKEAAKIARGNPGIFRMSVESNLEPTLTWLQERLDADEHSIAQMVKAAPIILSLNMHTGVEPKLAWLRDRVGLTPPEVCDVIGREPGILYKSIEDNLEPTLAWLKTHLKLDDEAAREMLLDFPRIVGSSLENNLKRKLPWFQTSLGLDAREAIALMKRSLPLLQYSTRNLTQTVSVFREEMNASEEELRDSVMRNPRLLGYSVEGRLRPRLKAMREANVEPVFSEHCNQVAHWDDTKFQGFLKQHGSVE